MSDPKKSILPDHVRKRKRLIPPMRAFMGDKYVAYSWARQLVPEFLWIAMIQQALGFERGTEFAAQVALEADRVCTREPKPIFSKITSFLSLTEEQAGHLKRFISSSPDYNDAMAALAPMFRLIPNSPFDFLRVEQSIVSEEASGKAILELMPKLYDRRSRASALAMAGAISIGFRQGKIVVAGDKAPNLARMLAQDFGAIQSSPTTEESEAAAASLRAMIPMLLATISEGEDSEEAKWLDNFWDQVGEFGECERPVLIEFEEEPDAGFWRIITRYRNSARRELYSRLDLWKFDLNEIECHEVVGGLLARQVTLVLDLAASPPMWTGHSAPIMLRAMADVHIVLAWIFESPQERAERFIEDGLGAVKLEIAHRKAELEKDGGDNDQLKQMIDYWERWLGSQRISDLLEVNLGSWSGLTTRKMAEEAGCLDFYNYVYQPFSQAVHSYWPHVCRYNLVHCLNPTHRFHRLAVSIDHEPDAHWIVLAAKYLEKTFKLFDLKAEVDARVISAYSELVAAMEEVANTKRGGGTGSQ